jgi:hypothetical protein
METFANKKSKNENYFISFGDGPKNQENDSINPKITEQSSSESSDNKD